MTVKPKDDLYIGQTIRADEIRPETYPEGTLLGDFGAVLPGEYAITLDTDEPIAILGDLPQLRSFVNQLTADLDQIERGQQ